MCISPSYVWVEKGGRHEKMSKPCGSCWRCRSNRVNDYVGRALCEAHVSDWTKVITLTYAPRDDGAELVINPNHFQTFIKKLRNEKLKIRYLVVAEFGELKGRVHFHAVLFGKGKQPQISKENPEPWIDGKMSDIEAWPHGHVFVDARGANEAALRYACKYVLKGEPGRCWFSLSKKPSLGSAFFAKKAAQLVERDVMPRSFEYMPPGGTPGKAYLLTGASRRDYLQAIIDGLRKKNSALFRHNRMTGLFRQTFGSLSEWVQAAVEKLERDEYKKEGEALWKKDVTDEAAWRKNAKAAIADLERQIEEGKAEDEAERRRSAQYSPGRRIQPRKGKSVPPAFTPGKS